MQIYGIDSQTHNLIMVADLKTMQTVAVALHKQTGERVTVYEQQGGRMALTVDQDGEVTVRKGAAS